jgi:hypothetical protein
MRRFGIFCFVLCLSFQVSQAQILKKAGDLVKGSTNQSNLSEADASSGIKAALEKGVLNGVQFLNKKDGFLGNELYKVLLPEEVLKAERVLRNVGMGSLVDNAITQINRSAEQAVGAAGPIFVQAIKSMSIQDAARLVTSGNRAATDFFQQKTTQSLKDAFAPVIDSNLQATSATKYYGEIIQKYNSLPTTLRKINPDLTGYVTEKAIAALFDRVALEEQQIRSNPAARTSEILKKVFGK